MKIRNCTVRDHAGEKEEGKTHTDIICLCICGQKHERCFNACVSVTFQIETGG